MTDTTPPALTAAQMAHLELLLKYIGPVGDDNLTIDEDNDVVVPGWGCLDMDDLRLLLHAIAIARSGDPNMADHTTTREYDQMRAQFDAIASREREALTTAQARIEAGAKTLEAREQEIAQNHRDWTALRAENTELRARIEALERERDAAVASRMSDHGILLDAWRDRGEAVPGVDRESTVLRVIRGIHAMRDRAEQAEAELTAALTRLDALVAFLPSIVHEQAQDTEYLVSYIETWRDDSAEFATLAGRMEAERDAARTRAEGLEAELATLREELELWRDSNWQALEAKQVRRG